MMAEQDKLSKELAITFDCQGDKLFGVLHEALPEAETAVLVVVGGRQYRAGAHRQFVLLARYLANHGVPVLRFDVRGMGDSEGQIRHFLSLDDDIAQAVANLKRYVPSAKKIMLWGLCDGASAAILHAKSYPDIAGVMLVNPWISTDSGIAKTYLKHYYRKRFMDPTFWRKAMTGGVSWRHSISSLRQTLNCMRNSSVHDEHLVNDELPDIIFAALEGYRGATKIVISDRDLTAREFEDEFCRRSDSGLLAEMSPDCLLRVKADHTFSHGTAQIQLFEHTLEWVRALR